MNQLRFLVLLFILSFFVSGIGAQSVAMKHIELQWHYSETMRADSTWHTEINLKNGLSSEHYENLQAYHLNLPLKDGQRIHYEIQNAVFRTLPDSLKNAYPAFSNLDTNLVSKMRSGYSMGNGYADIFIECFRKKGNRIEQLMSFDLVLNSQINKPQLVHGGESKGKTYADHSVLQKGKWYKIRISRDGVYKVSASELQEMGFSLSNVSLNRVRLYGNGGGMLPEANSKYYPDDLLENAIEMHDENNNNLFDGSDYFLFYGKGPNPWTFNKVTKHFQHSKHLYDDYAYYFITIDDNGQGKRIGDDPQPPTQAANKSVDNFVDYAFHEKDSLNLIKTGRRWFGEEFSIINTYSFSFKFPNIDPGEPVYFRSSAIARASVGSSMIFTLNGNQRKAYFDPYFNNYLAPYATQSVDTLSFLTSGNYVNVNASYVKPNSSAKAWLDFFEINAIRKLKMVGGQMTFRNTKTVGPGNISEFTLSNADNSIRIWDVTDPTTPKRINTFVNGSNLIFKVNTDSLREFCALRSDFFSVEKVGSIPNQDLHALMAVDYIILYDPRFKKEAEELADFHRDRSNMNVLTVEPKLIYNEFSSGAKDITAIRNFMRMLYERANGDPKLMPRYLLMFGDASYDFKNRIEDNTNLIPTYESYNSLSPTASYATDDYFGLLDVNEGANASGMLDVGIGRFPITTNEEARNYLNKIYRYTAKPGLDTSQNKSCSNGNIGISNMADWRNIVCFIGDDEDQNLHVTQANYLADYVRKYYPVYNVDKIFFDAYPQIITPGGQRYPDVKEAIRNRVERGALVINYTGHGGETGWAHESVLEINDIRSWKNSNNLPIFITATCEFSRYDDPERISAGEYILISPDGGGIALLTTSRVTWATQNFELSKVIYTKIFHKTNGLYPRLGDVIRNSKVGAGSIANNKNFVLLGDPALRLSYPKKEVVTTAIQGPNGNQADTISALMKVTIEGEVQDQGQIMSNFNGIIYPTIYDKAQTYSTLGNDPKSYPYSFQLQKNIIYKGKAQVKNGKFSFTFYVPKDINYKHGFGKISYYAQNGELDANGYFDSLTIGGSYPFADDDVTGPDVKLYMNNTNFVSGGVTNENPIMLAQVFDLHGINTVGNGIGHNIEAVLDENYSNPIILNDYYESELNDYQKGNIRYPFFDLSEGMHTLSIKVWDVYNNSSTAKIDFLVANSEEMVIEHLFNMPNPFTDYTSFVFEHNQSCEVMKVELEIYNVLGQLVRLIKVDVNSSGYRIAPAELRWDGTTEGGSRLASGVYTYRLKVQNADGTWNEKTSKLVFLNQN